MARKKEDNGKYKRVTNKSKKSSRDSKDVDVDVLKSQLITLGLTLREVPGDGNCLFRALGDQLDGHMGNHYRHRQDTTTYMLEHRDDFQPFVEDDLPFEKHISELSQPGTYAGNDAIVAFARLHQVTVVIHQPNAPLWQIRGWEINLSSQTTQKNKKGKNYNNIPTSHQLHIAYHGGDHYDSVRRLGDTSHIPANIQIDAESEANVGTTERCENTADQVSDYDTCNIHEINIADDTEANEIEHEAILRSGCQDLAVVRQLLYNNCGNLDAAVEDLLTLSLTSVDSEEPKIDPSGGRSKTTFSRKQLERIRKQERKRAAEARRKPCNTTRETPEEAEAIIIGKVQCLNI